MWSRQIRLLIILALLAIPIGLADYALLGPSGGGWISLDFRGLLIGAYLLFLLVHTAVSSLGLKVFHQRFWTTQLFSAVASLVLLIAGVSLYYQMEDRQSRVRYEQQRAERAKRYNVLQLEAWHFKPDRENATTIEVVVRTSESGRFACGAYGRDSGDSGEWYFQSAHDSIQHQVERNEVIAQSIPLERSRAGVPKEIEITLYLFADSFGSAETDVIKVYTTVPEVEDDGHYYYQLLPPETEF